MWCFAFNNTSCYCFYWNETIRKCDVLLLTIPVVTVSIAMKLLENVMFLLIAIPFVSVSIAMKLLEDFMFCF